MEGNLYEIIASGVSLLLLVLNGFFGRKLLKYVKMAKLIAEGLDDGKLTEKEIREIIRTWAQK